MRRATMHASFLVLVCGALLPGASPAAPAAPGAAPASVHGTLPPVSRAVPAVASSELPRSRVSAYGAANVVDGDQSTAWVEGVPGLGAGQWIAIYLGDAAQLRGLKKVSGILYGGYQKNTASYENNSRPGLLRLELLADSQSIGVASVVVQDAIESHYESATEFGIPVDSCPARGTLWLRATIAKARPGRKWADTGISEIRCDLEGSDPHGVREALEPFARAVNEKDPGGVAAFTDEPLQNVLSAFTNEETEETACGLEELRVMSDTSVELPGNYGEDANFFVHFLYDGSRWRLEDYRWWWHRGFVSR
jgi:hypothetical protein